MLRVTGDPYWARLLTPLGISYFTFKLIHYVVEVGRGNIKDRSLPNFLCYIFLFPIFTAGPIERFDHFLRNREQALSQEAIVHGLMRIIVGIVKMFFISLMPPLWQQSGCRMSMQHGFPSCWLSRSFFPRRCTHFLSCSIRRAPSHGHSSQLV